MLGDTMSFEGYYQAIECKRRAWWPFQFEKVLEKSEEFFIDKIWVFQYFKKFNSYLEKGLDED